MSAAQRKRRYRERASAGLIVLRVIVDEAALTDALVDAGHIAPHECDDREKIARGVERLVEEAIKEQNEKERVPSRGGEA